MAALTREEIERIVFFEEDKPFNILGPHFNSENKTLVIRQYLPRACKAWVKVIGGSKEIRPMESIHASGFYEAVFEDVSEPFSYLIGFQDASGFFMEAEDPYAFPTDISGFDLHLMKEGSHFEIYEKLGARPRVVNGVPGVHFAIWAPNAKALSIVGNFNHWFAGAYPMARVHDSKVWALFIPRLNLGELYKFAVKSAIDQKIHIKADPYALAVELRPHTASVIADIEHYEWHDASWLTERQKRDPLHGPLSVYEVHLGSWKKGGDGSQFYNYRDLARELVEHVKQEGYTHIELMPVMEHPLDESWGYQIINYYAPTSRFGTPEDFMYFVDYCHQSGIGVLLDWVPAHFPKDDHGLADYDGRQTYSYESWRKGERKDWGTLVFDFGKNEVRNFLIANALFWLKKYHVDGLRVDAVASMLYLDFGKKAGEWEANGYGGNENLDAIDFLKRFNEIVHANHPGIITMAEESTVWQGVSRPTFMGGLGFSLKWSMGWMNDTLRYFAYEPIHRKYHHDLITHTLEYAFSENFILPLSHDEVVYGKRSLLEKMPGDDWQKFANLRLLYGLQFAHPGKKLIFMGCDYAQRNEWNWHQSLDWHLTQYEPHRAIERYVSDLNRLYRKTRAFYEGDFSREHFEWIDAQDTSASVLSFLRWSTDRKELLVFVFNMTPVPRDHYRIGVPNEGVYEEVLNSDAKEYGGSGIGNLGKKNAESVSWHGRPHSLDLVLPPLACSVFRYSQSNKNQRNGRK